MTIPLTLPFEQHLKIAQTTIEQQVERAKPANRNSLRAKLWVNWINTTLLEAKPKSQKVRILKSVTEIKGGAV